MKKVFLLVCLLVSILSWTQKQMPTHNRASTAFAAEQTIPPGEYWPVYFEDPKNTLDFASSCYLGIQITGDANVKGNIASFESYVNASHDIYAKRLSLGEAFPMTWLFACISQGKIPQLILSPAESVQPYQLKEVTALAKKLSLFPGPIIIDLYPNPSSYNGSPQEYTDFYRLTRSIFHQYAPNTTFLWSITREEFPFWERYYPGADAVDLIGLQHFTALASPNEKEDIKNTIDAFCFTFQKMKPLYLSQIGISHFSAQNSTYQTQNAAQALQALYQCLADQPALRGITYMDWNTGEDYRITGEPELTQAYQQCLSSLQRRREDTALQDLLKSPFPAYITPKACYLAEYTLRYDLEVTQKLPVSQISEKSYWEVSQLPNFIIQVDKSKKRVIIKRN